MALADSGAGAGKPLALALGTGIRGEAGGTATPAV